MRLFMKTRMFATLKGALYFALLTAAVSQTHAATSSANSNITTVDTRSGATGNIYRSSVGFGASVDQCPGSARKYAFWNQRAQ